MTGTKADTLTVVFDDPRGDHAVTFTNVRYNVTWNRLEVVPVDGPVAEYDRLDIVGIEAFVAATPNGDRHA